MDYILDEIEKIGIIPVIKIDDFNAAVPLAKALINGGLPCAEVTFRTESAKESIRKIVQAYPNMIVGAGTVLTTKQVDDAIEAGAKFIVSPGLNPKIVKYCLEKNIIIIPGCSNPSDIEQAIELGLGIVKFFPAEAVGGIKLLKAMAAPYGGIKFMPTGGVSLENLNTYLECDRVIACGGTWFVTSELINKGNFEEIEVLAREAVRKMLGFELSGISINVSKEEKFKDVNMILENLFGSGESRGKIEMKYNTCADNNGVLNIGTNNIKRAMGYLNECLDHIEEKNKTYDARGKLVSINLNKEVGGFNICLIQK